MAVVIPVVAVGAGIWALVTGGSIGGTALGLSVRLSGMMKHTETPVTHVMNLYEGDHISVKRKGNLPFRHAIVAEIDRDAVVRIRVIYHIGSRASARVESTEVELSNQAQNGNLVRHQYEPLISYPTDEVVERARSIHRQFDHSSRRKVPQIYWCFFSSDKHFANWCQIGFCFQDGFNAALWNDYKETTVTNVARLKEGDHVVTDDGFDAIVVRVSANMSQLEVVRFPSQQQRGPEQVVINNVARVKRLDYDVAIGVNGQTAMDIAVREADHPTEPMPYSNDKQFALWCKTLLNPTVDSTAACALAAARMMGRVWAWVSDIGELTRGDHIAWKSGKLYYYQHAIVTGIDGNMINVVYLLGNVSEVESKVKKSDKIDVSKYLGAEQLCKYFYDVREGFDPADVIQRAEIHVGSTANTLPFKNPQHFAMWCKTGSYHLHC